MGEAKTRERFLIETVEWWRAEWRHKNREAEWLWRFSFWMVIFAVACFFAGWAVGHG